MAPAALVHLASNLNSSDTTSPDLTQEASRMQPDVVGIGAINFDYVYAAPPRSDDARPSFEVGREVLNVPADELAELIAREIHRVTIVSKQIGGSAYLAVRTIQSMNVGLTTGYVGVLGTRTMADEGHGFPHSDAKVCLDDTSWLFESDSPPGRALVHTWKGQRLEIQIAPGANKELLEHIHSRPGGVDSLAAYLASARWVHVSSLPEFDDFVDVMAIVSAAKILNRGLRCSVDPGYEYIRYHRSRLIRTLAVADLVFLSGSEADVLSPGRAEQGGSAVAGMPIEGSTKLVVVKGKESTVLIERAGDGGVATRTFWHRSLSPASIKNDTGAGDVFAGGFIAALLMDGLLGSQPSASRLAADLAAVRLNSRDFPDLEIERSTASFLNLNRRQERTNTHQRIQVAWERHRGWAGFIAGAVVSYGLTRLFDYLLA